MSREELVDKIAHIVHGAKCCKVEDLTNQVKIAERLIDEVISPLVVSNQIHTLRAVADSAVTGVARTPTLVALVEEDLSARTLFRYMCQVITSTADLLEEGNPPL